MATLKLIELENKIIEFGDYIKSLSANPNVTRHQLEIDTDKKVISLLCSCYTRDCTTDPAHGKYNRQIVYKGLVTCYLNGEGRGYPPDSIPSKEYLFGHQATDKYNISLVHEENNPHDKNSMMLILNTANHPCIKNWDKYNIGYIPGSMSEFFCTYSKYFTNIKIRTLYNNLPNNKQTWNPLHNLRISLFYRDTVLYKMAPGMGRFKSFE